MTPALGVVLGLWLSPAPEDPSSSPPTDEARDAFEDPSAFHSPPESPPPANPRDRARAERAFSAGERAWAAHDYAKAAEHFGRAYDLVPHPFSLYALGLARERAGDVTGAYQTFDRLTVEAQTEAQREEARELRDALRPRVSIVRGTAPGSLCIDGHRIEPNDAHFDHVAEPGPHRVSIGPLEHDFELSGGETRVLDLEARLAWAERKSVEEKTRPLGVATLVGAGGALALGASAAVVDDGSTRTGLAIGAAASAGVALGTGLAILILRRRAEQRAAKPATPPSCGGDLALFQKRPWMSTPRGPAATLAFNRCRSRSPR